LETGSATDTNITKFDSANTSFAAMRNQFYSLANAAYTAAGFSDTLRNVKLTESIGQNRVAGTITYSTSFNDDTVSLANALSEAININYDNTEGLNKVIAKIPIIGKQNGPIIQDMNTTTIKSVSATLDAVMDRDNRTSPPTSSATSILDAYKPTNGLQQTKTESWSPKTGTYNLSISWEYN
jgi:Sec7-like guanine-nucleotide exchange factor